MAELEIGLGALAALSDGQRAIAHLVVLLAVPVIVGLVFLVRRCAALTGPPTGSERQRSNAEDGTRHSTFD